MRVIEMARKWAFFLLGERFCRERVKKLRSVQNLLTRQDLEFGFSLDKFQGLRSFGFFCVILLVLSLVI